MVTERCFARRGSTFLAALDDAWVVHSGKSDSSHVLNEECAAVLRVLSDREVTPAAEVCARLGREFDEDPAVIVELLEPLWDRLIDVGLLTEHPCPARP